jgi:hypothetical protein
MADAATRAAYDKAHSVTSALYYGRKPSFEEILKLFATWATRL